MHEIFSNFTLNHYSQNVTHHSDCIVKQGGPLTFKWPTWNRERIKNTSLLCHFAENKRKRYRSGRLIALRSILSLVCVFDMCLFNLFNYRYVFNRGINISSSRMDKEDNNIVFSVGKCRSKRYKRMKFQFCFFFALNCVSNGYISWTFIEFLFRCCFFLLFFSSVFFLVWFFLDKWFE